MKLIVLGSSSRGNGYLLVSERSRGVLAIEAGIPLSETKKALRYEISRIDGLAVSHEHGDHAKHLGEYLENGIRVYALRETLEAKGAIRSPFARPVEPMRGCRAGEFLLMPFPVDHDVPCAGWVISHPEMGRLVFVTDTMMLRHRLPKAEHLLIEANYADDILQENIDSGLVPPSMRSRLEHSHMALTTTIAALKDADLSETRDIVLLHLSAANSDAERFRRETEDATGIPVYIADKGLTLDISKEPY